MSILDKKQLPPPKSPEAFENLCLDIWRRELGDPSIQRYGRSGQTQHGVDLIGRRKGSANWIGIQCKLRKDHSTARRDLGNDLLAAETLNPRIAEFVFATNLRRDTGLQDFARAHNEERTREGHIPLSIYFWDEIESLLQEDKNLDLLERHYSQFITTVIPEGLVIARMFSFSIGVEQTTTLYELIIGKTLDKAPHESGGGLSYFKDRAFMLNLQSRASAIFEMPPRHHGSLSDAINNRTDEYILWKWLRRFPDIDSVLRVDHEDQSITISYDEWTQVCPPRRTDSDED